MTNSFCIVVTQYKVTPKPGLFYKSKEIGIKLTSGDNVLVFGARLVSGRPVVHMRCNKSNGKQSQRKQGLAAFSVT